MIKQEDNRDILPIPRRHSTIRVLAEAGAHTGEIADIAGIRTGDFSPHWPDWTPDAGLGAVFTLILPL